MVTIVGTIVRFEVGPSNLCQKYQVNIQYMCRLCSTLWELPQNVFSYPSVLHYRPSICPCQIRVENALKTHVIRISFPTRISKIQSKPTFDTR